MIKTPEAQLIGDLRAYSRALTCKKLNAKSLVEETLKEAFDIPPCEIKRHGLRLCLITLLRHRFFDDIDEVNSQREHLDDQAICVYRTEDFTVDLKTDQRVEAKLHSLPLNFREPVVLTVMLGLSNEEAARIIGCDLDTINHRVSRGCNLLQMHLTSLF